MMMLHNRKIRYHLGTKADTHVQQSFIKPKAISCMPSTNIVLRFFLCEVPTKPSPPEHPILYVMNLSYKASSMSSFKLFMVNCDTILLSSIKLEAFFFYYSFPMFIPLLISSLLLSSTLPYFCRKLILICLCLFFYYRVSIP